MPKNGRGVSARTGRTARDALEPGGEGGIDAGAVYVNIPLAADMLGLETGEMRRLVEAGQIESVRAGETRLVPVSGIRRYLAALRS